MTRFEIYPERDVAGEFTGLFRWRARSSNGKITANGGEAFASDSNARRAIADLVGSLGGAAATIIAVVD